MLPMHPVPIQHSTQIVNAYPLAAVDHHIQHIVLLRRAAGFSRQLFPRRACDNVHQQLLHAPQPVRKVAALQCKQLHTGGNAVFLPKLLLVPGRLNSDGADHGNPISLCGIPVTTNTARHDPSQIDDFRAGWQDLLAFIQ